MNLDCIKMKQLVVSFFILLIAGLACCRNLGNTFRKLPNENTGLGIVNGKPVPITKYPYMVAFELDAFFSGGGVLLNDRWILTTVGNTDVIRWLDIYVGSKTMAKGKKLGVNKIVTHPKYEGNWEYDAALIKIVKPLKFNKKVKPITLATDDLPAGTVGSTAGWGVTEEVTNFENGLRGEDSPVLLAANNSVLDDADCKTAYGTLFNDKLFCSKVEPTGPCSDDYGSPFVVNNTVYGMFSGFLRDCTANPRVFVKISTIAEWANEIIKEK